MDYREYIRTTIPKNARILEFGPLHRPIADKALFKNAFYADIRTTNEIKKLYTGNDYLSKTGIHVPIEEIVDIDFVVKETYEETFQKIEKFDYVILAHVIEHMPNLLFFFKDIVHTLKPNGKLIIVYPDKRYSFDHFRESASFRDVYATYLAGPQENARFAFDFIYNVSCENAPLTYWQKENFFDYIGIEKDFSHAVEVYQNTKKSIYMEDIHYWPFYDYTFLKLIYDLQQANLISFSCEDFKETLPNTQEFLVILRYTGQNKLIDDKIMLFLKESNPNLKRIRMERKLEEIQVAYMQSKRETAALVESLEKANQEINKKNEALIKVHIDPVTLEKID